MSNSLGDRIRALLLTFLLALGISLPLVQGGLMAAEMAVSADEAHHGSSGCDGCGGGDHNDMNVGECLTICAATQALISGELLPPLSASQVGLQVAELLLSGQSHHPDHGPPKILILG